MAENWICVGRKYAASIKKRKDDANKEWEINNIKDTYIENEDTALFADDASIDVNQTFDIWRNLTEYYNDINKKWSKINWDNVNILTNKNINNIKNVIANPPNP